MIKKILFGLVAFVALLLAALPTVLHKAGLHPEYQGQTYELPGKRALVVTTSHAVLAKPGATEGDPTGVMASELTHPYYTFLDGGMQVDVASIKGGAIPVDPQTLKYMIRSPEDERYLKDDVLLAKVENSIPIDQVDVSQYDVCLLYTSPSPRDLSTSRMPSSA